MLTKVIIWGASGHAKVVAEILQRMGGFEVAGFLDDVTCSRRGEPFFGSYVVGGPEQLDALVKDGIRSAFVGFGNNARRTEVASLLESRGFTLVTAVHPNAVVAAEVILGNGTMVAAGAVISTSTTVGKNVIINTHATIDHDCVVEDGVHVSPGVNVAGNVMIGRCAWLGIGSTVIDKVRIGANSIVGAGAVVLQDVPEGVVVTGIPARIKRSVTQTEVQS